LRTLLDRQRRRVLVVATLWPQYWSALTTRPAAGEPDPYAQARDLLAGSAVTVADGFTPGELAGLHGSMVDQRLQQVAAHAEGGRITQYLAGAPELEDRYRSAPPAAGQRQRQSSTPSAAWNCPAVICTVMPANLTSAADGPAHNGSRTHWPSFRHHRGGLRAASIWLPNPPTSPQRCVPTHSSTHRPSLACLLICRAGCAPFILTGDAW
jgi:hypothetical protein